MLSWPLLMASGQTHMHTHNAYSTLVVCYFPKHIILGVILAGFIYLFIYLAQVTYNQVQPLQINYLAD